MKKIKFKYLITSFMAFIMFMNNAFAYGFNVSLTSTSVTVGNSVTLTISGSDLAGKFTINSSNTNVATLSSSSVFIDKDTQRITIYTKNTGSSVITINPVDVTSYSGETVTGAKSITITVNPKPTNTKPNGGGSSNGGSYIPPAKKTNSYLSSLTVDGLELNEKFDKESLEYTVTVPADTEKIKINAQLEDSDAKVTGTGEVNVSTGLNTFEIVVTAENGSKRTYILKATVEELKPIKVKIDNTEYTIQRKRKDLPEVSAYWEPTELTIDNEKIEAYYNPTMKYTIVGLKDPTGKISYYLYKNNTYTKYQEHTFNGTTLQILDKEVSNAKKSNFYYDSDKISSYQEVKLDLLKNTYALDNNDIEGNQYYLFYAINMETGKESLYQYDAIEKTVQRYNTELLSLYKNSSDTYYICLLGSLLLLGVTIIIFSTILICKGKKNKKKMTLVKSNPTLPKEDNSKKTTPIKEELHYEEPIPEEKIEIEPSTTKDNDSTEEIPLKESNEEAFSFDDLPIKETVELKNKKPNKKKNNKNK